MTIVAPRTMVLAIADAMPFVSVVGAAMVRLMSSAGPVPPELRGGVPADQVIKLSWSQPALLLSLLGWQRQGASAVPESSAGGLPPDRSCTEGS
jgi:hypothetical protein